MSDDVEEVREEVYQRELEDTVLTCLETLETVRDELEKALSGIVETPPRPNDRLKRSGQLDVAA